MRKPANLALRKDPGTHWTGDSARPRIGLGALQM
jgi:hypothetical protein